MIYNKIGKSGLYVSRICLGTMSFGARCDEKESFRIMDTALDNGITFFDTANVYGETLDKQKKYARAPGLQRRGDRQMVCPGRRPPGEGRIDYQIQFS